MYFDSAKMKDKKTSHGGEGSKIFGFRNYWKFYASVFIAVLIFESRTLISPIAQYVNE